jgi:hypothetical protein
MPCHGPAIPTLEWAGSVAAMQPVAAGQAELFQIVWVDVAKKLVLAIS